MATLSNNRLSLLDLAKRTDGENGRVATIVELLKETNEILDDISFMNGNLEVGHRTTVRTGIPAATWRRFNEGVQPARSTTAQVTFPTGMLESFSEMDADLAKLNGDVAATRLSEDMAFLQGINEGLANALFYGNVTQEPGSFPGLAQYYNSTTAESGDNLILGGGAGTDNASIFLVGWSSETVTGIVPKNSTAGMVVEDLGIQTSEASGKLLQVYRTRFQIQAGLAVKDWRYGVRIANIDRSYLAADPTTANSANLPNLMFEAIERLQSTAGVQPVFYMDRNTLTKLRQQLAASVKNATLDYENVGGRMTAMFQGIPIRRCDALATNEALVS